MRIAVNTRLLIRDRLEGIGVFAHQTLSRITAAHPEHEFIFFFDRPCDDSFVYGKNVIPVVLSPQARHPVLFFLWFEYSVHAALKKYRADLFLSPDGYLSLRTNVKSLAVIHDLNFEHYPAFIPWQERMYYQSFFPRFAKKAKRIATVSEYSKKDIADTYGVSTEHIDVVYNASSEGFKPLDEMGRGDLRKKYSDGIPYFLYVGSLHQRKNIVNLLKAFDAFRSKHERPFKLILAGSTMWSGNEMDHVHKQMKFQADVNFIGHVAQAELEKITASAFALTYVPFFEGFGIPPLEAMSCKVPVVVSGVTSLSEVCGDAALFVHPSSVDSITDGMLQIVSDENLRNNLIRKGTEQAQKFSWNRSADLLWESMMKAAD